MEYIGFAMIVLIVLVIKSEYNKRIFIKKQIENLNKNWGKCPDREYTQEQFNNIKYYFNSSLKTGHEIDDITWNDLNMDSVFMMMNNTQSAIGEEFLYRTLRDIKFNNDELLERSRLSDYFATNKNDRIDVQMLLKKIGKSNDISIYEYVDKTIELPAHSSLFSILSSVCLLISLILAFIKPNIGIILSIVVISNNVLWYYKRKAQIEHYFTCFGYILKMLDIIKLLNNLKIDAIGGYTKKLDGYRKYFSKFKNNTWLLIAGNGMKGSFEDMFFDYIRMLFHVDLIKFDSMLSVVKNNKEILKEIMENLSYIDTVIAIASFRNQLKTYSEPILVNEGNPSVDAVDIFHPFLECPITNSFKQNKCVLITGSNASGKSTFLKTIAINAILSQTIYTSTSNYYKANFYKIYSSMALRDNIFNNESYYIVEIKSLKRILDADDKGVPILCFVDEVLRGTNTVERIAASSEILRSFSTRNIMCLAATHDIELTYILESCFTNYHFKEDVVDNDIRFDYKLYKGRSTSRNAIKLLEIMGYDSNIINRANKLAQDRVGLHQEGE